MRRPSLEATALLFLMALSASGQVQDSRPSAIDRKDRKASEQAVSSPAWNSVPLDAVIDESAYIVGPGDLFSVNVWTIPPTLLTLPVSAQGSLIIPLVGEISVFGKSLRDVRLEIQRSVRAKVLSGDVSVALLTPRRIVVRVRGWGVNEGSYVASASDRVQDILARSDIRRTVARADASATEAERDPIQVLRRSIMIFRNAGEPVAVDLDRYDLTRLSVWSPYLQEGDEIVFSPVLPQIPRVTVGGSVRVPGTYEFRPGDLLRDVIGFARGFAEVANPDSVRVTNVSGSSTIRRVGPFPALDGADLAMNPGDRVFVPVRGRQGQEALVWVEGELRQTGLFPIVSGITRLSEILQQAGGPTAEAMIHAGVLFRGVPNQNEAALLRLTAYRGNSSVEDTTYVRLETEARSYGERVNVDVARAWERPGGPDDAVLIAGDRIVVPRRTGTVYVFGQVVSPGHVTFMPGASVDDYLEKTGGLTSRAKSDEVVVIKRATRQWSEPGDLPVEEGDQIWVPKTVDRDLAYDLGIVAQIASIVSAAATLIILVGQVSK